MRPLNSHFPVHALTTLATMLKQTKEARVFRRAQAVRAVVAGHHLSTVSATCHLANAALRKWVQRLAQEGPQGLRDRARSGRPPQITCELAQHLNRLVDQAPLEHSSLSSPWSCRELATVFAREPGVQLGRESVCGVLKKSAKLLPPHRTTGSQPIGPRLGLNRTRGSRIPGPPGRDHCALCRRNHPLAFCPPSRRLVAQSPTLSPAHAPAESESEQT